MDVRAEFRILPILFDQIIFDIFGMGGGEADTRHAGVFGDESNQLRKTDPIIIIGIDGLA